MAESPSSLRLCAERDRQRLEQARSAHNGLCVSEVLTFLPNAAFSMPGDMMSCRPGEGNTFIVIVC